jgi:predicted DNA binding CopG/RHH family protein
VTKLTKKQERELEVVAAMPDDEIDLSDIPEATGATGFVRGRFYRPVTRSITIRMNAPDVAIAQQLSKMKGLKYQTYIKLLLHEVLERERAAAIAGNGQKKQDRITGKARR